MCCLLVNGEHEEEDEEEEELYELTSLPNGQTTNSSSDAEVDQDESNKSGSDEGDPADSQSESVLDVHRALIEDIRCVI